MIFMPPVTSASPAPLMFAHAASHVLASSILFDRCVAFGTPLELLANCPSIDYFLLLLAAGQILMPRD